MATAFQQHVQRWSHCTACPLCEKRKNVVLVRGKLPADVLFIGEAPGQSEDVLGKPFCGPAGQLLDHIIERAVEQSELSEPPRMAWTNLIACIPKDETNVKVSEPPDESIEACESRLVEIVNIAKPRTIVLVGKLAKKHVGGQAMFGDCNWVRPGYVRFVDIDHPAFILRLDVAQRGLVQQRCQSTLADAFDDLAAGG